MWSLLRRLLGIDLEERMVEVPNEQRDRDDALRSAARARQLARTLREDRRRRELALRLSVVRRSRQ